MSGRITHNSIVALLVLLLPGVVVGAQLSAILTTAHQYLKFPQYVPEGRLALCVQLAVLDKICLP